MSSAALVFYSLSTVSIRTLGTSGCGVRIIGHGETFGSYSFAFQGNIVYLPSEIKMKGSTIYESRRQGMDISRLDVTQKVDIRDGHSSRKQSVCRYRHICGN